jgi:peroxiredoxin
MQAYQLGAQKFDANDTQVFGVSTDNTPSQKEFATKLSLSFPLLSDFVNRKVSEAYGVLIADKGYDNRVSFVIDKEGKITYIETGKLDINGTDDACSRLAHRTAEKN